MNKIKTLAPLAMRQAPRVYNSAKNNDRVIELQNFIIIVLTGFVLYYNSERVRIARIALPYTAQSAVNSANTLNEIKEINKKIKS